MGSIRKILNEVALLVLLGTKTAVQKALTNFLLLKIKWAFLLFKSTKIILQTLSQMIGFTHETKILARPILQKSYVVLSSLAMTGKW